MSDFVKEEPDALEIEGIRYSKALFREWGMHGAKCGTLFKILNRDNTITIQILPDLEGERDRYRKALEEIKLKGTCYPSVMDGKPLIDSYGQIAKEALSPEGGKGK